MVICDNWYIKAIRSASMKMKCVFSFFPQSISQHKIANKNDRIEHSSPHIKHVIIVFTISFELFSCKIRPYEAVWKMVIFFVVTFFSFGSVRNVCVCGVFMVACQYVCMNTDRKVVGAATWIYHHHRLNDVRELNIHLFRIQCNTLMEYLLLFLLLPCAVCFFFVCLFICVHVLFLPFLLRLLIQNTSKTLTI